MKYILTITFIAALTGCATPLPVISVRTQIVDVPVPVVCNAVVPSMPLYNFDSMKTSDDVFDKTKALLADRKLSLGYQTELLAALLSCVK